MQQRQQLAVGLSRKSVSTESLFEPQLHQDAEADFLAMQNVMAGLQLGEAVMHRMGRHRATTGTAKAAHHAGRQGTGFSGAHPGGTG